MRKPDHSPVNDTRLSFRAIFQAPLLLVFVVLMVTALTRPNPASGDRPPIIVQALSELPRGFTRVAREPGVVEFLGPDGRRWQVRGDMRARPGISLEEIERHIEQSWSAAMPRLEHARPALFEEGPGGGGVSGGGGRIWFIVHGNRHLLGYDGKEWIRREAVTARGFVGRPPGHGRLFWAEANLHVGDDRYFLEGDGVHVFDGRDWDFQSFEPVATQGTFGRPVLLPVVQVDGVRKNPRTQVFVVLPTGSHQFGQVLVHQPGRWLIHQQGRWRLAEMGGREGPSQTNITHAASTPEGLLVLHGLGGAGLLTAPQVDEITAQALAEVPGLIQQLGDPRWREREAAHERLFELRDLIEQPLRQAREQANDPDLRARLDEILGDATFTVPLQFSPIDVANTAGDKHFPGLLSSPDQLATVSIVQGNDGMVMILSGPRGKGRDAEWMARIRQPNGTWRDLPIDESIARSQMVNPMPALHAGHQRYWLGGNRATPRATLIDISGDRVRVLARSPEPYATVLYARSNGEALLAPFDPLNLHTDQPLLRYESDILMELGIHLPP
ncbi:MAG: hypothetical protein JJU36_09165 [Phycisphaeraceae bacterium]|nr:hypothetical protein [Phycisphaeraceae bacterium]